MTATMSPATHGAPQIQTGATEILNGWSPRPSAREIDGWTATTNVAGPVPRTAAPADAPSRYSAGIDQVRYWVGAAISAVVAALVGIVGLVVAHGIVHVPVMLGSGSTLTPLSATLYGLASAAITLAAAALFDGMLHVAPRPTTYYSWLIALGTTLAVLLPFTTAALLHSQVAFAAMNLGVGLIVLVLVPMAAVNARQ